MRLPGLSKLLIVVHAGIAFIIFLSVVANAGGYQNGVQWAIIAYLDLPICYPIQYIPERIFNPAVVSESKLNWLTLAYVLTAGTIYWYAIGWLGDWVYRRLRKPRANEIGSSVGEKK